MNLFGKAKQQPKLNANESIARLKETLNTLQKREAHLGKRIANETAEAKKHARAKNQRAALMNLKRRKTFEQQIEKLGGARMTIERQIMLIEDATATKEVMDAMKMGADTLKNLQGNMSLDQVDDTMDDIREQMDIANDISDAISQPLGFGVEFDEDELNAELELLEQEDLMEQLPTTPVATTTPAAAAKVPEPTAADIKAQLDAMPSAPAAVPAGAAADEQDELAKLQAEMAM